jgi:hypothetical protein
MLPLLVYVIKSMTLIRTKQVACFGDVKNTYIITVRKPEGKMPFVRLRKR